MNGDSPAVERLRRLCLALPEATEKVAWGEPTFRVRERMFATFAAAGTHHGTGSDSVWCPAPIGVQEMLVRQDPGAYFVPPYVGVRGWVGVRLDAVTDEALAGLLLDAFAMVAPKRILALLDGDRAVPVNPKGAG